MIKESRDYCVISKSDESLYFYVTADEFIYKSGRYVYFYLDGNIICSFDKTKFYFKLL